MSVFGAIRQALRDRRGATGAVGAISLPALVMMVGASVDYGRAELTRARLQAAADAAVLSVTQAQILVTGSPDASVEPFIEAYLADVQGFVLDEVDVVQDDDGYARVEVTGASTNMLLGLLGFDSFHIHVAAEAQYADSPDLQFTIVLDNSASMLFAATEDGVDRMLDRMGCAFACHYGSGWSYQWAEDNDVTLRLEAGQDAILRAFQLAEDHEYNDQADIFFGIYTMALDLDTVGEGSVDGGLDDLSQLVSGIGPLAQPSSHRLKYTLTNYEETFDSLAPLVIDLREENPDRMHFLLIITDGVADYRQNNGSGGRRIEPFPHEECDVIRDSGIRIGIIYTTYFEMPSNSFWRSKVRPFTDEIGPDLQSCASETWFFEAGFQDEIDQALIRLMTLAIPTPILTE